MPRVKGATAAEFAEARFGGPTRAVESRPIVTTAGVRLIDNNPRRVFWLAINRSVNFGAIGFDATVTGANGILIGANGGFVSMDVREDGEIVAWAVYAANDTASGSWYVLEILRV